MTEDLTLRQRTRVAHLRMDIPPKLRLEAAKVEDWLAGFVARAERNTFLTTLTGKWDLVLAIRAEDTGSRRIVRVSGGTIQLWEPSESGEKRPPDLVISGRESDLMRLFSGDELHYWHAKPRVTILGAYRDRLKVDALLRLVV